jgi:membrane-bound lytic murein transglycosylase B
MFQTLKEGLKRARLRVLRLSKLNKKFLRFWKKQFKKATIASIAIRLILVTTPSLVVPAMANNSVSNVTKTYVISISKNDTVFSSANTLISIVPGESNAAVEAKKKLTVSAAQSKEIIAPKVLKNPNPSLDWLRGLYGEVGSAYGVPSQLLEAIHQVESGKSGDTAKRSSAGATGPMQFLPSTFRHYNPTGDITKVEDSMVAAAKLLAAGRDSDGSWDSAILNYNHSISYLRLVKSIANELGANI